MPELPEVEVLVRHLRPLVLNKTIRRVEVCRARVISPTPLQKFQRVLVGAKITGLSRRGKYLLFQLQTTRGRKAVTLLGHLGMTGRMFMARRNAPLPKHAAVVGRENKNGVLREAGLVQRPDQFSNRRVEGQTIRIVTGQVFSLFVFHFRGYVRSHHQLLGVIESAILWWCREVRIMRRSPGEPQQERLSRILVCTEVSTRIPRLIERIATVPGSLDRLVTVIA